MKRSVHMGRARALALPGPNKVSSEHLLVTRHSLVPFHWAWAALIAASVPFVGLCEESAALAQLPVPDATHFGTWLMSATAVLSIAALGKQFVRKTPLEAQFLTRKDFAEFREKLD